MAASAGGGDPPADAPPLFCVFSLRRVGRLTAEFGSRHSGFVSHPPDVAIACYWQRDANGTPGGRRPQLNVNSTLN